MHYRIILVRLKKYKYQIYKTPNIGIEIENYVSVGLWFKSHGDQHSMSVGYLDSPTSAKV